MLSSRQMQVLSDSNKCAGWKGANLGVEGDPCHPVGVALPAHDEVPPGQVPHLPGLVITACHLQPSHTS